MGLARSLVPGDELRHAPPGWLAGLTWGAWLLLGCLVAFAVLPFVFPPDLGMQYVVAEVIALTLSASFLAGAWLLTRPQPRFDETTAGARRATRAAAAALVLQVVTLDLMTLSGSPAFYRLTFVFSFAFAAFPALLFRHLRRLALRVLNPGLAEHCAIIGYGASAALVLLFAMSFAPDALYRGRPGRYLVFTTAFLAAAALLSLLWSVWALLRFALALGKAWRASRDAWDAADASAVVPGGPPARSGI
jgi:hypothetical protein